MDREPPSLSVILHVDLDCFYAAVERARLGIPVEKPLAVQQWEGLIAVNYAARAAGIVRHDRVADALRKCPDLQLVHVETIGNDKGDGVAARRDTSKVSLERYRQASRCVFDIFQEYADICERASIDEAYLDVTKKVEIFMTKACMWSQELERLLGNPEGKAGMVIESGSFDVCDLVNRRLLAGAIVAEQIRNDVRSKLGYTCSVGIATNKLLAKIASARNKPDQQTLVLPGAVSDLMNALPLKKVKLLGGKIGEELSEKWNCKTAGDAQKVPLKSLLASFGDRLGNYVYRAVRGIHEDKVQGKQTTKSMLAAKSFQATNDISVIRMWLGVLAEELSVRMLRDAKENYRQPHNLQLYYRSGISRQSGDHSKSCSMPHTVLQLLASACVGTPRVSAVKQQAGHFPALSRKCSSNHSTEEVLKTCEGIEPDQLLPLYMEHDSSKASPPSKDNFGCLGEETRRTSPPGCVTNVHDNHGTENEETSKELSNLLQQVSFQLFQRLEDAFPCTRLAIAASGFHDAPAQGSQSIQHFFGNSFQSPKVPPIKSSIELVGEDKLANKRKGLLRYLNESTGPKKPCVLLCESEGLASTRKDMEKIVQVEYSNSAKNNSRESLVDQNAKFSVQDARHALAVEPALSLSNPNRCLEAPVDQQGSTTDLEVDMKDIDVDEQCRILKEIYEARTSCEVGHMPLHHKLAHTPEKQRKLCSCDMINQPSQTA
ncbi:hypothetical protein GOP47_0017913 [Adiantum capillus-veneris]|uniref:UmuC domain-containing protein n=1 Tax=Adiantum capillus-veneris TaxID=13818 RepID=A0A9D4UGC8_ADICA|nr:hypothetical protein GOP47_0017913 [Adiantum capillus-veneris]